MIYNFDDINPYIINCGILNKANCSPAGTVYEQRVVKWFEIELIFWGEGHIFTEGNKIKTERGDIFFRTPGMVVQGVLPYYCSLIIFDMFFDKDKINLYSDPNLTDAGMSKAEGVDKKSPEYDSSGFNLPHVLKTRQFGRFEELFLTIYNGFINCKSERQFYLKTFLMQILLSAYKEWSDLRTLQHKSRSVVLNHSKVMLSKRYIDENICSRFTLLELADIAELSPNFFCRAFKNSLGVTPIEYINNLKMNFAKKLLIETNKGIKEIAYECGYENDTYFYTLFKKLEGISPAYYRERQMQIFPY